MNENIHDILHDNKWIMFHGLPAIALGPSINMGILTQTYDVVPQHGPLLLYTKLEGPSNT